MLCGGGGCGGGGGVGLATRRTTRASVHMAKLSRSEYSAAAVPVAVLVGSLMAHDQRCLKVGQMHKMINANKIYRPLLRTRYYMCTLVRQQASRESQKTSDISRTYDSTREVLREKSTLLLILWFVTTELEYFVEEEPARTRWMCCVLMGRNNSLTWRTHTHTRTRTRRRV